MNNEIALEWVEDRLVFISKNCDLNIEDNKKAYEVLSFIKNKLEN
jgi:hypothetical protein